VLGRPRPSRTESPAWAAGEPFAPEGAPVAAAPDAVAGAASATEAARLDRQDLPASRHASPRRRLWFHPRTGWFRRLERAAEHLLSRHVYPRVPGLARLYSFQMERHLTLVEGDVPVRGLPREFDGARVLLVTDIHVGPFVRPEAVRRVLARLQSVAPDLVLLGGDLATARVDEFPPCAAAFRALRAPLGVFAVLGNHDHYTGDPAALRAMVEGCGIPVLHNRSVVLERGAGRVVLAGVDDMHAGFPDLGAALAGAPAGLPVILLSHNPDIFFEAIERGVALVLSGHTHGGQIRVPGLPVLVRMSRYRLDEGPYEADGARLVVSRGLGVTGVPLRLACPPEAVLVRLRRAPSG
jgi:hypothetical protein